MDYSPWGRKESDTTERLHSSFFLWTVLLQLIQQLCEQLAPCVKLLLRKIA